MKNCLFILLYAFPLFSSGQINTDSEIYSMVVNDKLSKWNITNESGKSLLIIDQIRMENFDADFLESLSLEEFSYIISFYEDNDRFPILEDNDFKSLLSSLKGEIVLPVNMQENILTINIPYHFISRKEIDKLFKGDSIKGWGNFYKMHPAALGYFEFSKITYSEKYAILYSAHRYNSLGGEGRLEIFIKEGANWKSLAYCNVWYN